MEKIILRLESIQQMAEKGVCDRCFVDDCEHDKLTPTAYGCKNHPGIAKRGRKAVENYKKTAFIIESKQRSQKMNETEEAQKLGPKAWRALQEEIKAAVGDQDVPNELIVKVLGIKHPDFSKVLCQKAVGNFRKWQRFLAKVVELYEIDLWLGEDEQKAILVDQIRDCIDGTEFDHFSREVITQACYEGFPMVKNEIIRRSEELAEDVTFADSSACSELKTCAYEMACDISDSNGRIEGYAFCKLLKAVAERMTELRKARQVQRNLEALKAKKAAIQEGHKKTAEILGEMAARKKKIKRKSPERTKKEFHPQPKVEIWKKIVKKPEKPVIDLSKVERPWIFSLDVSSEAFQVYRLNLGQLIDEDVVAVIPEKELVAEAEGNILYEKKDGQLVRVGQYRLPTPQEKKVAKQATKKALAKKRAEEAPSEFARVARLMPEVACQPAA